MISEEELNKLPRDVRAYISKLEYDVWHDALTGVLARKPFIDLCKQEMAHINRKRSKGFALMFVDVDEFKKVNDLYGHGFGDEYLKIISKRILGNIRQDDALARYGGDEFIALIRDVNSKKELTPIFERLKSSFDENAHILGRDIKISISVGTVFVGKDDSDLDSKLIEADKMMYKAKQNKDFSESVHIAIE